jgi:hypothetical protein
MRIAGAEEVDCFKAAEEASKNGLLRTGKYYYY